MTKSLNQINNKLRSGLVFLELHAFRFPFFFMNNEYSFTQLYLYSLIKN